MKTKIQLQENEEILLTCQPQKALTGYLFLSHCLFYILVALFISAPPLSNSPAVGQRGLSLIITTAKDAFSSSNLSHTLVTLIVVSLIGFCWCVASVCKYQYFFTNQRCIVYSGFWGANKKFLPYKLIVDINVNRNLFRKLFGISAISLTKPESKNSGWSLLFDRFIKDSNIMTIDGLTEQSAEKIAMLLGKYIV